MPKIKSKSLKNAKKNRNREIQNYFKRKIDTGFDYDFIMDEIMNKWGLSHSTIYGIIKERKKK